MTVWPASRSFALLVRVFLASGLCAFVTSEGEISFCACSLLVTLRAQQVCNIRAKTMKKSSAESKKTPVNLSHHLVKAVKNHVGRLSAARTRTPDIDKVHPNLKDNVPQCLVSCAAKASARQDALPPEKSGEKWWEINAIYIRKNSGCINSRWNMVKISIYALRPTHLVPYINVRVQTIQEETNIKTCDWLYIAITWVPNYQHYSARHKKTP